MSEAFDTGQLPAAAQKLLAPAAPKPVKMMAAKGIIPGLKPGDIVTVLALLGSDEDAKIAESARTTLGNLPPPILNGALNAALPGFVTEQFAHAYAGNHDVIEQLLRQAAITLRALERLADAADEKAGELIATNEALMLKHPTVIEKLYMNERVRMSTADRLLELAVRNGIELSIPAYKEAAAAIQNELIPEPSEEPTYDDMLFEETGRIARETALLEDDDTHEVDEEGEERVREKFLPLHARIAAMTITQKIRRAMVGAAAERLMLVRDPNRLVAAAAAKSPRMQEPEAVRITASRAVSDEVLRIIALNREFTRSYQVKLNLVVNPRTPFTFSSRLVPHIRDADLKKLAKSKNVSGAIAQAIKQQMTRKNSSKR
ncbi:MAG TPA: hypothetical protein VI197_32145 [Polyangiaceae bacterium]